jgi:ankyrin repeat protein
MAKRGLFQLDDVLMTNTNDGILQLCTLFDLEEFLDELVNAGHPVNHQNMLSETALLQTCRSGSISMAKKILGLGDDASICGHIGQTPLHSLCNVKASSVDTNDLARRLCSSGGDPNKFSKLRASSETGRALSPEVLPGSQPHFALSTVPAILTQFLPC